MSAKKEQNTDSMVILAVNIHGSQIVLPGAAIAEIIDFQPTQAVSDDAPTWYLGTLNWRGLTLPLVSLEGMNHNAFFTQARSLKIIVMHCATARNKMLHWGFVAMETPRMLRIDAERLHLAEGDGDFNAVTAMWANLDGETVMLPDLQRIEQEIVNVLAAA